MLLTRASSFINLVANSQGFDNASWVKQNSTITADATTGPDGTLTADQLNNSATVGALTRGLDAPTIAFLNGAYYTFSMFMLAGTQQFVQLEGGTGAWGTGFWGNFDLTNGVVGSVGVGCTSAIQAFGGGWYRCWITGKATANASSAVFVRLCDTATDGRGPSASVAGTNFFLWQAQVNLGQSAGPVIRT